MSEHERGSYTPQPDAPLSFDARISREHRPLPLALFASCILLGALIVALFLFYRSGMRGSSEAPMPVGTPVEQYKSSPPPPVAPNSLAIQTAPADSSPAGLAPTPEQPIKRALAPEAATALMADSTTRPGPPPVALTPAEAAKTSPQPGATAPTGGAVKPLSPQTSAVASKVASAPAAPAPAPAPAPAVTAKAAPAARAPASAAPAAPTKPAVAVAKAKAKPPLSRDVASLLDDDLPAVKAKIGAKLGAKIGAKPAAKPSTGATVAATGGKGGSVVQIGAYLNEAQASAAWQKVAGLMGGAVSGKGRHFEPVTTNGAVRYRSQVTGFASRADATAFCVALKTKGHDCIVKSGS